jgi:acyl-CoA reductase-like NAD-dependent aldehyde dehydrogenase
VVIEDSVFDTVSEALVSRADALRVGCDADMGSMISLAHQTHVQDALQRLLDDGARVLTKTRREPCSTNGFFLAPVILEASSDVRFGEIFGPVLVLLRAKDRSDAMHIANDNGFGLSFSIFTQDNTAAEEAVSLAEAGLCHVNFGTGYRHSALPLLGWKRSGRGAPESGTWARDFFTQTKAIYMALQ